MPNDNDHDQATATDHPTGEPMTATPAPDPNAAFHRQRGLMPKSQATQAAPQHDPRGRMPNDNDHDQATATDHPTGEPMTATAMPAPDPNDPNGAPMTADPPDDPVPETLRMLTSEDALRAALNGVVGSLGRDEVRVLTRIAERLQVGSRLYGAFDLATDARVFRGKEAREELEDALVYLACAWLKTETHEVTR